MNRAVHPWLTRAETVLMATHRAPSGRRDPEPWPEELFNAHELFQDEAEEQVRHLCVLPRQGYVWVGPGAKCVPVEPDARTTRDRDRPL